MSGKSQINSLLYNITTTDLDGNALTLTAINLPTWLTLTDNGNGTGTLKGTPSQTDAGSYNIVLQLNDGITQTQQTFTLVTNAVNDTPTLATNAGFTLNENTTKTITATDLNTTDTDNSPSDIIYTLTQLPKYGSIYDNSIAILIGATFSQADIESGKITYAHDGSKTTADSFSYKVSDGINPPINGVFAITISPENDVPVVAVNAGLTLTQGSSAIITTNNLQSQDIEQNLSELIYTLTTLPTTGTLTRNGTILSLGETFSQADVDAGVVAYTHNGSKTTEDSFSFTLIDGAGGSVSGNFRLTINSVTETPTPDPIPTPTPAPTPAFIPSPISVGGFAENPIPAEAPQPIPTPPSEVSNQPACKFNNFFNYYTGKPKAFINLIFDEKYYLENNPDVAEAVAKGKLKSGFQHFLKIGQFEGRNPSVLFNNEEYIAANPDVAEAISKGAFKSGVEHFLKHGFFEERDLRYLMFDESYYRTVNTDVEKAIKDGIFQTGFEHFIKFGQYEWRNPSDLFNQSEYVAQNPDAAAEIAAGKYRSAFQHFMQIGIKQGKKPSGYFDSKTYLEQNLDVQEMIKAGVYKSAFEHYLRKGIFEDRKVESVETEKPKNLLEYLATSGRGALALFYDEKKYLEQNPDAKKALLEGTVKTGLEHFLKFGANNPQNLISLCYSEQKYLENNPDIADAVAKGAYISGLEHYLEFGIFEGRDTEFLSFDEIGYLENNPDVKEAVEKGIFTSGFEHFKRYGK